MHRGIVNGTWSCVWVYSSHAGRRRHERCVLLIGTYDQFHQVLYSVVT